MTTVLAIDQGTSGTKALVVDPSGAVRGLAESPVRPVYGTDGSVELDPRAVLETVLETGRAAIAQARTSVDIVTLANQGETVLAWDPASGDPLTDMIVWQDRRASGVCTQLASHRDSIESSTGLTLDPYFSAPKQAWIRRQLTRDGVVTTSDTWLLYRLTGEFVTDVSTASRSLVASLGRPGWDPDLLELFDLAHERMPRILESDALAGTTAAFGGEIPVGGLVVDQQAALIAESCIEIGAAKCTFGTGAFLLANAGPVPQHSRNGLSASMAWTVGGEPTYCVDGQVYTVASAVRWMQSLGFFGHASELDGVCAPDSGGVMSVPALAGLGAPWWRPDARATISGLSLATGVGHIVRAVLEGVAAQVAELCDLVSADLGRPLTALRVDGGLTRSHVLMQAVADLTQIAVEVYPSAHATPLGAAALARVAFDPRLPLSEAIVPWSPAEVYEPEWSQDRAEDFRSAWRSLAGSHR